MENRKKIALCLEYPIALRGGVSVLVETLLEGLSGRYDLILVSTDAQGSLRDHPVLRFISGHITWEARSVSAKSSRQLACELSNCGVKLAHFHSGGNFGWGNRFPNRSPVVFMKGQGMKTCSTVHLIVDIFNGFCGPQKPLWFKLALLPVAWLGKMQTLLRVEKEIAVSKHDEAKLRRWYWPVSGKFSQIYHSRLKMESLSGVAPAREPFILNVGHVAWRKGQVFLAEAFAKIATRHREWKLFLAGDLTEKPAVEAIRAIAKANGLDERIILLGERNDAIDLMKRCSIYVQPSYQEALGLALQEALFVGCPGVGTRVGGIPELIDHEKNGLLVKPGSVAEMAAALERLIADPKLRETYGRAATDSVLEKKMTVDQMVAEHIKLYESILGAD